MHSEQPPLARLITGAILAGGESRRLGRDKAQVNLGGRPLASWVAESLGPQVADLWLITNHPLAHLTLGLPILTDLIPGQGPLGGLHTALFYALTPWVLAVAVDCPFLDPALVAHLAARALKTSRPALVYGSARGLEPFPGLYHKRLAPQLETFLATDRRLRIFVEQRRNRTPPMG
jgi:molybdopterin-guanine dinucleotide biosynthesis protein A